MSTPSEQKKDSADPGRRNFLRLGLAGAGVAAAAAGGMTILRRMEGIPHDDFPLPIRDDFKPIDQCNMNTVLLLAIIFYTLMMYLL